MTYSSQKHSSFVLEPIGYKSVTQLPGIGAAAEQKLKDAGIEHVYVVLGQFLFLKKDEKTFKKWIQDIAGVNVKHQDDCFQCLNEWCNQHLFND